jgi:hypothetical protein
MHKLPITRTFDDHLDYNINALVICAGGKEFLSLDEKPILNHYSIETGELIQSMRMSTPGETEGDLYCMACTNKTCRAFIGGEQGVVYKYYLLTKELAKAPTPTNMSIILSMVTSKCDSF